MSYKANHALISARVERKELSHIKLAIHHDWLIYPKEIVNETLSDWLKWLINRRIEEIKKGG